MMAANQTKAASTGHSSRSSAWMIRRDVTAVRIPELQDGKAAFSAAMVTPDPRAAATLQAMATREEERALVHEVADAIGALMEFWGFKRVMGRLWTVLYLTGAIQWTEDVLGRIKGPAGPAG